jgi:hypothetical protein
MEFPDLDLMTFMFDHGNYACDCNRALFFDGSDTPCTPGDDYLYSVEVLHNGEVVYSDFKGTLCSIERTD